MHKKNSNGWILCKSKSFPGKLYYFNVVTGEAAWGLNELGTEKETEKKDSNIPQSSVKFNNYSEPNTPPVENYETLNTDSFHKHHLMCNSVVNPWIPLNQVLHSNYLPQPTSFIPNVMWTPAALCTQMFMPNGPEVKKQMSNQITQTHELKEKTIVHATGMPLSGRFFSYYKNSEQIYSCKDSVGNSAYYNCHNIDDVFCCNNDNKLITSQCKTRFPLLTERQSTENNQLKSFAFDKISPNSSETILFKQGNENVAIYEKSTENKRSSSDLYVFNKTKTLGSSDLRHILLAKKNNCLNIQHPRNRQFKGDLRNRTGTVNSKQAQAPNKRVSFNFSHDDNSRENPFTSTIRDVKINTVCTNQTSTSGLINIWMMKSLRNQMAIEIWFVMADLNVLLNDFQFIDNFVRQDESCRLAIPNAVLTIIKELSTLNQNGSKPILSSRNILRRLMDSPRHITLLNSTSSGDVPISKQMLDCCLKLLERNYHVVLVTTDVELFTNGKAANLHCYMLQQIHKNELTFRFNNKEYSSQNDQSNANDCCGEHKNLFLKKPNQFQPFVIDNEPEKSETRFLSVQNVERNNVKSFKKVIDNDLCNGVNDYESTSCVLSQKYHFNDHKITDPEKTGNIKVHRIISSNTEHQLNETHDKPTAVSFKIKVNQKFHSKDIINKSVNTNQTIKNKHPNTDCDIANEQNYQYSVSSGERYVLKENENENNIINRNEPKPYKENHQDIAESMGNTLYVKLDKYYVKDKLMSERIRARGEEWMCCFTQFMEYCLLHLLLDVSTSDPVYPCSIPEAAGSIAKLFKDNDVVETAAYGLSALYNTISLSGKLKPRFNPDDLLKTIGCGMLLVESLMAMIPSSSLLKECEYSLIYLLNCIEDPESDPKSLDFVDIPSLNRCDDDQYVPAPKSNYVKKRSEILAYLKNHFPEWKAYDDDLQKQNSRYSTNVVRTVGRHLNLLKINAYKDLILSPDIKGDSQSIGIIKCTRDSEIIDDTDVKSSNSFHETVTDSEKHLCLNPVNDSDHRSKHNDAFVTTTHTSTASNVVKNQNLVGSCKDKLNNVSLNKNVRKCNELNINTKTLNSRIGFNNLKFGNISAYRTAINNDSKSDKMAGNVRAMASDVSNDDSGLGNENCPEHTVVKSFLMELSSSLAVIYTFINESIVTIKVRSLQEENKKALHDKTDKTYKFLLVIVDKLKRIIGREPDGETSTVKSLLIRAGAVVANDKRVSRYKQVVTKCLEQANLLKHGLKLLLNVTNENSDSQSLVSELDQSNVCYFNIFEQ